MRNKVLLGIGAILLVCLILGAAVLFALGSRRGESFSNVQTTRPEAPRSPCQARRLQTLSPLPPSLYACQGDAVSPSLSRGEPLQGARAFALIVDDPEAPPGVWVHWVAYNIPEDKAALLQAIEGHVLASAELVGVYSKR